MWMAYIWFQCVAQSKLAKLWMTKLELLLTVDGIFSCKEIRQFCNRNLPCAGCVTRGKDCHRPPGLQPARIFARRKSGRKPLLDDTSSPTPKTKRVWVKKEVMSKMKKERDTKDATIINLIDPQEDKPPGIRRPDVWCEVRCPIMLFSRREITNIMNMRYFTVSARAL